MIDTEILQDIYTDHDLCGTQRKELVKVIAMIKQNRLIELPCAVGDLVYMIKNMDSLVIPNPNKPTEIIQIMFGHRHIPLIGINVFLTKEEAEAKLEELKGE